MTTRRWPWTLLVALLPVAVVAIALATGSASLARRALAELQARVLLLETAIATVVAPIATVAVLSSVPNRSMLRLRALRRALGDATLFILTSALCAVALLGSRDALAMIVTSHLTMWTATLMLIALGAVASVVFRQPLDAAAAAIVVSVLMSTALLILGSLLESAPGGFVTAGLFASPLLTVAGTGHVDIVRGELLYRFSPLAHIGFEYPTWRAASTCYALLAGAGLVAATRRPLTTS